MKKKSLLIISLSMVMCACGTNNQSSSISEITSNEESSSISSDESTSSSEESSEQEIPVTPITEEKALELTNNACSTLMNDMLENDSTYKISVNSLEKMNAEADIDGNGSIDIIDRSTKTKTEEHIFNKSLIYNYSYSYEEGYRKQGYGEMVIFDGDFTFSNTDESMFKATAEKLYCLWLSSMISDGDEYKMDMYCTDEIDGVSTLTSHIRGVVFSVFGGVLGLSEDILDSYKNSGDFEVSYGIKENNYIQSIKMKNAGSDDSMNDITFTITANKDNFMNGFESKYVFTNTIDDEIVDEKTITVSITNASINDIEKANTKIQLISETEDYPEDYSYSYISNYLEVRNGL